MNDEDSKVLNPRKNLEEEYLEYEAKVPMSSPLLCYFYFVRN